MKRAATITLLFCLAACSFTPIVKVPATESLALLEQSYLEQESVPVDDLLHGKSDVASLSELATSRIRISKQFVPRVQFSGFDSPAQVAKFSQGDSPELVIRSFIVHSGDERFYMFYPIVSAFNSSAQFIAEVLPEYEFDFKDNVLRNHFVIPADTAYLIIHTKPQFVGMTFASVVGNSKGQCEKELLTVLTGGSVYGDCSTFDRQVKLGFVFAVGGSIKIDY